MFFLALALLGLTALVGALPKVSRTGKYLYTEDGNRFFIKGVAYQKEGLVLIERGPDNPLGQPSTYVDNLADDAGCARDLPFLQKLGVNVIRAYSVTSSLNHDACMNALSAAGIYVIVDLSLPINGSIDTTIPAWSTNIRDEYTNTIDVLSKYDNILAYNVGNEVLTRTAQNAAPFIKAAARDIKAYLASKSLTGLIGYAAIDGPSDFRDAVAHYLSCDPTNSNSGDTSIDLFGMNSYAWCGNAGSGTYDTLNGEFQDYPVAAYFSEYGSENCNPGVRPWTEVGTMFNSPMTDIWSGGIAFGYFSASSAGHQFGMIDLSQDNTTVTPKEDFNNLAAEYAKVTFVTGPEQGSVAASKYPACPTWSVSNVLPATPDEAACNCLQAALHCRFIPQKHDYNAAVGELLGAACGYLAQNGHDCADISANGTSGTYGKLSMCEPTIKLSYAMSLHYEGHGLDPVACSFAGNGTINRAAPTLSAPEIASSCIANPAAVFTADSHQTTTGPSNPKGSGVALSVHSAWVAAAAAAVGGALWTLAA